MSVRLTTYEGVTRKVALYDSTSDTAFGPVFEDEDEAGDFLYWLAGNGHPDPRTIRPDHLIERVWEFRALREVPA